MTQLERFDDLERSGFPVPPELGSIIRKVQAERDATLGNRDLTQEARQRLDRELVAGGVELVKPAEAAVIERELKTFDREEGDARTRLKRGSLVSFGVAETESETMRRLVVGLHKQQKLTHLQLQIAAMAACDDSDALEMIEDAVSAADDLGVRTLGQILFKRVKENEAGWAQRKPVKDQATLTNPHSAMKLKLEALLKAWKAQHPTPRERLADIARRRNLRRVQLESEIAGILHFVGWLGAVDQHAEQQQQLGRARAQQAVEAMFEPVTTQ